MGKAVLGQVSLYHEEPFHLYILFSVTNHSTCVCLWCVISTVADWEHCAFFSLCRYWLQGSATLMPTLRGVRTPRGNFPVSWATREGALSRVWGQG